MEQPPLPDVPAGYQPYTNCKTRIVDLRALELPEAGADEEYRHIYKQAISQSTRYARDLQSAIESIKYGLAPPVAFPTETVYGLGHSALSTASVASIFATKGRPSDNPLIVHASSLSHLERMINAALPAIYAPLVHAFWPGPLTILLPVPTNPASAFSPKIHPGQRTIAFRIPSNKYARFFIAATDTPIAGPSANSSGKPSPTTASHVYDDLHGRINFILDGGPCDVGVESTVVDGLHDPPLILRPGGVSLAQLRALGGEWASTALGYKRQRGSALGTPNGTGSGTGTGTATPVVEEDKENDEGRHVVDVTGAPRAPGMKYRHYAPQGRLVLFSRDAVGRGAVREKLQQLEELHKGQHVNVGVITRRWGRFAGLTSVGATNGSSPTTNGMDSNGEHGDEDDPVPGSHRVLGTAIDVATLNTSTGHSVFLHEANLGPDVARLAHELFYVLRKFDELGCKYIFAEMVEAELEDADDTVVDAVVDRIGKASSERVE